MRRRLGLVWLAAALAAPAARAELAVLENGATFKVVAWRIDGDRVAMRLADGGEVATLRSLVRGFVPDEVLGELEQAAQAARAGGGDPGRLLRDAAARYGLDPALVRAVVQVESNFQPDAVSPKGAQGLMQLMPGTAAALGVKDAFDPEQNLDGGARHLSGLLRSYGGDVTKALAAYNAGAAAVARHGGVPPFRETRDYVARVLKRYRDGS